MVTTDPHGDAYYTALLLTFYNRVAEIVAAKHPDRPLAALLYANYMYPPKERIDVEPNLYLVLTPLRYYGWGLQKPAYRREFPKLVENWTDHTSNLLYHN